ncbi:MAG: YdeI/OmpD-associated family protein [Acidobacteria bacterium]|nr:YdeI/OmpD-associated family protein [Acidobacteriota bacterium]
MWLDKNHTASSGVWLRLAKKTSGIKSVSYNEAVEAALCYGWIDGQKKSYDETTWLQKFTPRGVKSIWSKINKEKATQLIESGQMKPSGLKAIENAKQNGRWDEAYDSQSGATVPSDFQTALDRNAKAKAFFATLDSLNRYAILFRIQTAKKAETRTKRIEKFILMLEKKEKIYPTHR